jgi:hypothetical protein
LASNDMNGPKLTFTGQFVAALQLSVS